MRTLLPAILIASLLLTPAAEGAFGAGSVKQTTMRFVAPAADTFYVGLNATPVVATWFSSNLSLRYGCTEGLSGGKPYMFALASAGGFNNLNNTGAAVSFEITQDYGNNYFLGFSNVNCSKMQSNYPAIEKGDFGVLGTRGEIPATRLLATINYFTLNITTYTRMTPGSWDLLLLNNASTRNVTQIQVNRIYRAGQEPTTSTSTITTSTTTTTTTTTSTTTAACCSFFPTCTCQPCCN